MCVDAGLVDRAFGPDAAAADQTGVDQTGVDLAAAADVRPAGPPNIANALAAAALARAYGVLADAVRAGLRGFTPDPHRNALVAVVDQVSYVDDSKATNPHAAAASLAAYPSVVWVAGGLGKGLSFDELVLAARERLRAAVLMGSCRAEPAAGLAPAADVVLPRARLRRRLGDHWPDHGLLCLQRPLLRPQRFLLHRVGHAGPVGGARPASVGAGRPSATHWACVTNTV